MAAETRRGAVLITGASTGIGLACALHLDRLGFDVVAGVRKGTDGAAVCAAASPRLSAVLLDVASGDSIAAAMAEVAARVGASGLAGLVNNAGIAVAGPLEILPIDELRTQLEVNVIGLVAVTQAALPLLRRGHGRIANIGSISGRMAMPVLGPYAASKFAVEALTDSLRVEVQPWGIEVALIEPGAVATPIWDKGRTAGAALKQRVPPAAYALYAEAIARLERAAARADRDAVPPEDVARAVEHALTAPRPRTRYLVGKTVRIQALIARLPDRLRDRLLTRFAGFPARRSRA